MSFLQKLKNGLARLMYGRNGVDQLTIVIVWTGLIFNIISAMIIGRVKILGLVSHWLSMGLLFYCIFRIFSKNLYKRREENNRWVQLRRKLKSDHNGAKARRADKEHKYFTCKNCKAICRVPVGKGVIEITCPKCGTKIQGKS